MPHFRPMNVSTDGHIDRTTLKFVEDDVGRPDVRLQKGDVLFNNTNSPELVGKTALFDDDDGPAFSNHMTRLRVNPSRLDPAYLALRLHQAWREGWFAEHCNNHVSQASIGRDVLKAFDIALPPLEVQQAIASLNFSLEVRRSSAAEHLDASELLVDRFRQAVLTAACTGRLTEDFRTSDNETTVEHSLADLASRRKARRRSTEQAIDIELPELPASYLVATVGDAAVMLEYGTSKRCVESMPDGIPVLRMGNIQDGALDLTDLKFCEFDSEIERLLLEDGDLLFNRTNSPELVGKSAVFHGSEPMSFASYLIRVRFSPDVALPDFVAYWLNSAWGRAWAQLAKTDGVSQSNINGSKLSLMPLPLPPVEEQAAIVDRVSKALAVTDLVLARIGRVQGRIDKSSYALLRKAFDGEVAA
jgi:type I restriction enzyme S subunit